MGPVSEKPGHLVLYMATLTATSHNAVLQALGGRGQIQEGGLDRLHAQADHSPQCDHPGPIERSRSLLYRLNRHGYSMRPTGAGSAISKERWEQMRWMRAEASRCRRSRGDRIGLQAMRAMGVFGDRVIAIAILDRPLHHAVTFNIRGNSYRLKEKVSASLLRTEEAEALTRVGEVSTRPVRVQWAGDPLHVLLSF